MTSAQDLSVRVVSSSLMLGSTLATMQGEAAMSRGRDRTAGAGLEAGSHRPVWKCHIPTYGRSGRLGSSMPGPLPPLPCPLPLRLLWNEKELRELPGWSLGPKLMVPAPRGPCLPQACTPGFWHLQPHLLMELSREPCPTALRFFVS